MLYWLQFHRHIIKSPCLKLSCPTHYVFYPTRTHELSCTSHISFIRCKVLGFILHVYLFIFQYIVLAGLPAIAQFADVSIERYSAFFSKLFRRFLTDLSHTESTFGYILPFSLDTGLKGNLLLSIWSCSSKAASSESLIISVQVAAVYD